MGSVILVSVGAYQLYSSGGGVFFLLDSFYSISLYLRYPWYKNPKTTVTT